MNFSEKTLKTKADKLNVAQADTTSHEGGAVYALDTYTNLFSTLATTKMKDSFYESATDRADRIIALDIANLSHPNPSKSKDVEVGDDTDLPFVENGKAKVLDILMADYPFKVETTERNSTSLAESVKQKLEDGKITKEESVALLAKSKLEATIGMIQNNTLGIHNALKSVREFNQDLHKALDATGQGQAEKYVKAFGEYISNTDRLLNGLVWPMHLKLASEFIDGDTSLSRDLKEYIQHGHDAMLGYLKELAGGNVLVAVDTSASMNGKPIEVASYFGAIFAKYADANLMAWATNKKTVGFSRSDTLETIQTKIKSTNVGYGTDFGQVFRGLGNYDTIVVISDNQCRNDTREDYADWLAENLSSKVVLWDIQGYGNKMLEHTNVSYVSGWSFNTVDQVVTAFRDEYGEVRGILDSYNPL